jgi:hypothetical protein
MSLQFPDHVAASRACRTCGGRGTIWDWDFDLSKVTRPCPDCRPKDARLEAARAALAREFGRDRTPKRPTWSDPRLADSQLPEAELVARLEDEDAAVDGIDRSVGVLT